jgi:hypothetical protein
MRICESCGQPMDSDQAALVCPACSGPSDVANGSKELPRLREALHQLAFVLAPGRQYTLVGIGFDSVYDGETALRKFGTLMLWSAAAGMIGTIMAQSRSTFVGEVCVVALDGRECVIIPIGRLPLEGSDVRTLSVGTNALKSVLAATRAESVRVHPFEGLEASGEEVLTLRGTASESITLRSEANESDLCGRIVRRINRAEALPLPRELLSALKDGDRSVWRNLGGGASSGDSGFDATLAERSGYRHEFLAAFWGAPRGDREQILNRLKSDGPSSVRELVAESLRERCRGSGKWPMTVAVKAVIAIVLLMLATWRFWDLAVEPAAGYRKLTGQDAAALLAAGWGFVLLAISIVQHAEWKAACRARAQLVNLLGQD